MAAFPQHEASGLPGVNLGDTNFEDGFAGPGLLLEEFPEVARPFTLLFPCC